MNISILVAFVGELCGLIGVVVPMIIWVKKIANASRCQLRSDMLAIYYRHRETQTIRQYEYENFVLLYEGYKALKGNSFIDRIYKEVQTWEIVS